MDTDSTIPSAAASGPDDLPGDGLPVGGIEIPHARPLGAVAIAILCFAAVAPALGGRFLWLDSDHVALAPSQQTWHALARIWTGRAVHDFYAPLSQSLFWLEGVQWPSSTVGYHLVNLLLHFVASLCLWRLLNSLALRGAWLAAAIWAVHPLQVQSVAWIANQPMLLASVIGLLSLIAAVRAFSLNPRDIPSPTAARLAMIAYHLLLLAAILADSALAIIPLIVIVLVAWRRGKLAIGSVPVLIPSILIGLIFAGYDHHLGRRTIDLAAGDFGFTVVQRILIASRAVWFYLGKLFLPWPLCFVYTRWPVSGAVAWQWTFPAALLAAMVVLWRIARVLGRAPLVTAAIVLIAIFPTLGFLDLPRMRFTFVADDYAYLAVAPVIAAIAHLLFRRRHGPETSTIVALACSALLIALASVSCLNSLPYRSATLLWKDTLAKCGDDGCWLAHDALAIDMLRQINPPRETARDELEHSLRNHPHQVEAHILLGQLLLSRNNFTAAAAEFQAARDVADQPDDIRPGLQIAESLLQQGKKPEAAAAMASLVAMDKNNIDLRVEYATVLANIPKAAQAADQCRAILAIDDGDDRAWALLANCLWQLGQFPSAADAMRHAIDIGPPDAQRLSAYGLILLSAGRTDDAVTQLNAALKLEPRLASAHRNLAEAYAKQGKLSEARQELRRAQSFTGS